MATSAAPSPADGPAAPLTRDLHHVCFVSGAWYTGSTLLGLMLGSHPAIFYAGEAWKSEFLGDMSVVRHRRVCRLCGEACPVWGGLVAPGGADLYETLSQRTGSPVIFDSSKRIEWVEARVDDLSRLGIRTSLILLQRDGRGVLCSRLRKFPEQSVGEYAEFWIESMAAARALLERFPGEVTEVRYERLATQPEQEMRRLLGWLGLRFHPATLEPWTAEQHPLSGNTGTQSLVAREQGLTKGAVELDDKHRPYYAQHPSSIVLDLRWRQELCAAALAEFERLAGEANAPYAWEGEET